MLRLSKTELSERHFKRVYGRLLTGIQVSQQQGYGIVRRHKWSRLEDNKPCIMFLTLTSSEESPDNINYYWKIALKRIRKDYKDFQYAKIRTFEGVKGVLHIICRAREFIPHNYLSAVWSDTFKAPVVWTTQAYGNKRTLLKYLVGYFGHHVKFHYGASLNWIFKGFAKELHRIFTQYSFDRALYVWTSLIRTGEYKNVRHTDCVRQQKLS